MLGGPPLLVKSVMRTEVKWDRPQERNEKKAIGEVDKNKNQGSKELAALAENLGSVPRTHRTVSTVWNCNSRDSVPSSGLHTWGTPSVYLLTHRQNTHTQLIKRNKARWVSSDLQKTTTIVGYCCGNTLGPAKRHGQFTVQTENIPWECIFWQVLYLFPFTVFSQCWITASIP